MGEVLSEADVARILSVPEPTVRRLFDEEVLTGTRNEDAWQTTVEILEGDVAILIEGERIARLREGQVVSPWAEKSPEDKTTRFTPEQVEALINKLESASS